MNSAIFNLPGARGLTSSLINEITLFLLDKLSLRIFGSGRKDVHGSLIKYVICIYLFNCSVTTGQQGEAKFLLHLQSLVSPSMPGRLSQNTFLRAQMFPKPRPNQHYNVARADQIPNLQINFKICL